MLKRPTRRLGLLTAIFALTVGLFSIGLSIPAFAYGPTTPSLTGGVTTGTGNVDTVNVVGSGFQPSEIVNIQVHSNPIELGTVTADSAGAFSATFTLPAGLPAGAHAIIATGETSGITAQIAFTLAAASQSPAAPASTVAPVTAPASSLPYTGTDVALSVSVGAGALVLGGLLVLSARRRRNASWVR